MRKKIARTSYGEYDGSRRHCLVIIEKMGRLVWIHRLMAQFCFILTHHIGTELMSTSVFTLSTNYTINYWCLINGKYIQLAATYFFTPLSTEVIELWFILRIYKDKLWLAFTMLLVALFLSNKYEHFGPLLSRSNVSCSILVEKHKVILVYLLDKPFCSVVVSLVWIFLRRFQLLLLLDHKNDEYSWKNCVFDNVL